MGGNGFGLQKLVDAVGIEATVVDGRLLHVTPSVDTEAAPVVGAREPQALHPWQGMDNGHAHSL